MREQYNVLDLFAGIGTAQFVNILLGGEWNILGHVDKSDWCCNLIRERIVQRVYQPAIVHCMDVREFIESGIIEAYKGVIDCITGGPPCQSFSAAGRGHGEKDTRNAFPELIECCSILRPRFVFMENSPNITNYDYFTRILGQFTSLGYDIRWDVFSAAGIGACHLRKRLWILAYDNKQRCETDRGKRKRNSSAMATGREDTKHVQEITTASPITDSHSIRCDKGDKQTRRKKRIGPGCENKEALSDITFKQSQRNGTEAQQQSKVPIKAKIFECNDGRVVTAECRWWDEDPADITESGLVRLVYGAADRVNRIKALGNAWVPAVAAKAWSCLKYNLMHTRLKTYGSE